MLRRYLVFTIIGLIFFIHILNFYKSEKIVVDLSISSFESTMNVLGEYFKSLANDLPSGLFTLLSGLILFDLGTKKLEEQKQLSNFRAKYIDLRNKIDVNKKNIKFSSFDSLRDELIKFSDNFILYTNLIYEEKLAYENSHHFVNWLNSYREETDDWNSLFKDRIKRLSSVPNESIQKLIDKVFDKNLFDEFAKSQKLNSHIAIQRRFLNSFDELLNELENVYGIKKVS